MTNPARPIPYPADTRAKGWRFELDYEKIDQSDTWGLAAEIPLARPCLVMMWLVAWTQEPCGSLPNDEAIIRARCHIPAKVWPSLRELMMRGWWLAEDGRLYHDTLTQRVLEMLEYRRKNAQRVADFKARQRDSRGGNALPTDQQQVSNDTGTGTGTNTSQDKPVKKPRQARSPEATCPDDVDPQVWSDWVDLRKKKRTTASQTAIEGARVEAAKAGMSLESFLRIWCRRGSQGLEADWIKPHERPASTGPITFADKARERMDALTGRRPATQQPKHMGEIFDASNLLDH